MLSKKQDWLYWREWKAACAVLMPGRETFTKHEENERRHDFHREHSLPDSHTEFTNRDLHKFLGACRALSRPDDLDAQLRQADGDGRRARFGLDELMRKMNVDR